MLGIRLKSNIHGKQRNYIIILIFCTITSFSLFFIDFSQAHPWDDPDNVCHDSGEYKISTMTNSTIYTVKNQNFTIDIKAEGPGVILEYSFQSLDNPLFSLSPADRIEDNSLYDMNSTQNVISLNFTLTSPDEEGTYELLFYVRSPPDVLDEEGKPYIDFLIFEVIVETRTLIEWDKIFRAIFDHYNIYLGLLAIICLSVGTILSEIDYRKFIKTHGIFLGLSLLLTSINTIYIITETLELFGRWLDGFVVDLWHLLHIGLGIIGFGACFYGFITGLSGIRHRKSGYIALLSWGFNFIFGLIYWGIKFV